MAIIRSTGLKDLMQRAGGKSLADALVNGILVVYGVAPKPVNADATEGATAVELLRFTNNGGAFTPGVATNGINLATSTNGIVAKAVAETWKATGLADGTALWARFYNNAMTKGASTTAVRMDLTVGISDAFDVKLRTTTVRIGDIITSITATFTGP